MTTCTGQRGAGREMTLSFTFDLEPEEAKTWAWNFPTMHWNRYTGTLTVQFCRNSPELEAITTNHHG